MVSRVCLTLGLVVALVGSAQAQTGSLMVFVSYPERIESRTAVLEITLEDVTAPDAPAVVVATSRVSRPGQSPAMSSLRYDPASIVPSGRYAVRARIVDGTVTLFSTAAPAQVLTNGKGSVANLTLTKTEPLPASATAPAAPAPDAAAPKPTPVATPKPTPAPAPAPKVSPSPKPEKPTPTSAPSATKAAAAPAKTTSPAPSPATTKAPAKVESPKPVAPPVTTLTPTSKPAPTADAETNARTDICAEGDTDTNIDAGAGTFLNKGANADRVAQTRGFCSETIANTETITNT